MNNVAKYKMVRYTTGMYVSELIIDFLEYLEIERGRSQKTTENYHLYLNRVIEFNGDIPIEKIDSELVRKWRLWLNRYKNDSNLSLSPVTQSYHLIALRSFLAYCLKRDIACLAPNKIELPKTKRQQVTFLTPDEIGRMLGKIPISTESGLRDRSILELLFSSGLRVSELVGLDRDHINTKRREFTVRGKGQKDRPVYIGALTAEHIGEYLALRQDSLPPLFISYRENQQKSIDNGGNFRRLTSRSIQRLIKQYALRAGITKPVSPHTMRHSFATDLLINGADIRSVQSLLGHSNISTTQIYTHITDQHLKEVHDKFHKEALSEE